MHVSDNRKEKENHVQALISEIKDAQLVVVLVQNGLDADQTLELRRAMRAAGVTMKVGKNTLTKLAIKGTPLEGLEPYMKGPTALAYSTDPVAAAKVAATFAKKNDKLELIAASMGGQILDAEATKILASLPSLDELRGTLIGLLVAPATKLVRTLNEPAGQMVRVLNAKAGG
ncbi:MAG: 50S ribosomal protein L10 [Alphaproteobacteria bacterium]|nr:50S ribosomal protein L10 [Alphaproteobacteria bacterium]